MERFQHLYQHTFQDGAKMSMTVAIDGETIVFFCVPDKVALQHEEEYLRWRDEAVLPDLMERLTPEQVAMLVAVAFGQEDNDEDTGD